MYSSNLKWMERDKMVTNLEITDSKQVILPAEMVQTRLTTHDSAGKTSLNDIGFRLVLIPFFGIAIPLLTGMIDNLEPSSSWTFKVSFLYTIGIAWVVWEGNRFLLFTLRNYFDWYEKPMRKIGALLLVVPFYTIPISVVLLSFWFRLFANGDIEWSKVWLATAIILICVVFIVHVYETVFLLKEAESEKIMNARLEKARAEAELQTLKTQLDPHFIFNSLNTLSYFIEKDPVKAKVFNQKLSDMYRYILHNRDQNFVFLSEEILFVKDYFAMLEVRFSQALRLVIKVPELHMNSYLILPISIQLLVENAVKHNEFSDSNPLFIEIIFIEGFIEVSNLIQVKNIKPSLGLGLQNLDERSKLLMRKPIIRSETNGKFSVKIPISRI